MTTITAPEQYHDDDLFIDLEPSTGWPLHLKVEGLNLAGSIKLKAATEMVRAAESAGVLRPGSIIVESSSGNLGVALAMLAANRGYGFVCVTDSRCNLQARQLMEVLGGRVHVVSEPHPVTGFLGARLEHLRRLCASDDRHVWLDQYVNPHNWGAHFRRTAPAIARGFPDLDVLFLGAGTCGTLMGCARWFREWYRPVHVVAVDSVGSVTFGDRPSARMIPGLGSGVPSRVLDTSYVDEVMMVEEADTVRTCHRLARAGFLFGGSTGSVVSAASTWLAQHGDGRPLRAVAVAPDLGERYLDTVYQSSWVSQMYGDHVLDAGAGVATSA